MGHLRRLRDQRCIEVGVPMPVHVAPHARGAIEIAVAGRIDKPAALPLLDQEWLILLHLREGMPHVVAIEGFEIFVVEHPRSLQSQPAAARAAPERVSPRRGALVPEQGVEVFRARRQTASACPGGSVPVSIFFPR